MAEELYPEDQFFQIIHTRPDKQTHKVPRVKRCWMVSSAWSQRGPAAGWRRSPLANQSAVQYRLRIANQMKNLQQRGASDFQILFQGANLIDPMKNAL
jgi:hypothetical protein